MKPSVDEQKTFSPLTPDSVIQFVLYANEPSVNNKSICMGN